MTAARAAGVKPLIAFNRNWRAGGERRLPSLTLYKKSFRLFRARYPDVRDFSAWNEANHTLQPTAHKPRAAAQYFNAMRRGCRSCRIVAADVLDSRDMLGWIKTFKRYAPKARIWGLHNYKDANDATDTTKTLLKAVRGQVWLTETGGILRLKPQPGSRGDGRRSTQAKQAAAVKRVYKIAARQPPHHADLLLRVAGAAEEPLGLGVPERRRHAAPGVSRAQARPAALAATEPQPQRDAGGEQQRSAEREQAGVRAGVGQLPLAAAGRLLRRRRRSGRRRRGRGRGRLVVGRGRRVGILRGLLARVVLAAAERIGVLIVPRALPEGGGGNREREQQSGEQRREADRHAGASVPAFPGWIRCREWLRGTSWC